MKIDFNKGDGLVPVIIQDVNNLQVLMLGFMNEAAYNQTVSEKKVTFFSRTKNRLWTKGESSGNFLLVEKIHLDCDQDTLLIMVNSIGPTCHTQNTSCFNIQYSAGFLYELEQIIHDRINHNVESSYTNKLYKSGINKVAQKVGEEAIELVIEAKDDNDELFKNEAADLLYHFLILLKAKKMNLLEVEDILRERLLR